VTGICRSREQLHLALPHDRTRAVVMTMGALHAGHALLIDAARSEVGAEGHVTVTIFVNPLQFGAQEDFGRYPRTPEADLELCRRHGADLVFLPSVADVYGSTTGAGPGGISVDPGELGTRWEGEQRPGHFAGMLTVVLTLLHLTRADVALFGEKDYQQLTLVRAMVRRFAVPVRIVGCPTVRDADGLALSSRNAYLDPLQRATALAVPGALQAARAAADAGGDADVVVAAARGVLREAGLDPDYLALTDPDLGPPPSMGPARLLVAVRLGSTRLLDTTALLLRGAA
jgi:pantoate--beta-alanine ligase